MKEFKTTIGIGSTIAQPTMTVQSNGNTHPYTNISRGAGNLVLVNAAGTVTITSSSLPWADTPTVGDDILIAGFVNTDNNGRFTITSVTGYTVTFTNASGVDETLASAQNVIKWLHTPVKVFQDVIMTSGVPCYAKVNTSSTLTINPTGGTYCYITVVNSTDADCLVTVSGGTLMCPAGGSIGHEVKPFHGAVTAVASGATAGSLYVNIS